MNAEKVILWIMMGVGIVGGIIFVILFLYGATVFYEGQVNDEHRFRITSGIAYTLIFVVFSEYFLAIIYALFGIRNRLGLPEEDDEFERIVKSHMKK